MIPGIMEHIERAGVHSAAIRLRFTPPYHINDKMIEKVCRLLGKAGPFAWVRRGLVNIQYLIYRNELVRN